IDRDGWGCLRLCLRNDQIENVVDVPNRVIVAIDFSAKVRRVPEELLAQAVFRFENVRKLGRDHVAVAEMRGIEMNEDELPRSRVPQGSVEIWKHLMVVKIAPGRHSEKLPV